MARETSHQLLVGPPLNFGDRVNTAVKTMLDELATKIKLASQPKE